MFRRSPVEGSLKFLSIAAALAVLTFFTKACTEPEPTANDTAVTEPQLAGGGGSTNQCNFSPCVQVNVKFKGNVPSEEVGQVVVTLVHTQEGPFDEDDKNLIQLTDGFVATFQPDNGFDLFTGNYCAHARPLTDADAAQGSNGFVPSEQEPTSEPLAVVGVVTAAKGKQEDLDVESWGRNCLGSGAFTVEEQSQVGINLTFGSSASSIDLACTATDGAPEDCLEWVVGDLSGFTIPWSNPPAGVKPGLLLSQASATLTVLDGLPPGIAVAIEAVDQQGSFTASLEGVETQGGKKGGQTEEDAELDPLVCVDNSPGFTETGDPSEGVVLKSPIHFGYFGADALTNGAEFSADADRVAIWDQVEGSDGVTLKFRLKLIEGEDDDLQTTISGQASVNVGSECKGDLTPGMSTSGPAFDEPGVIVTATCRQTSDGSTKLTWTVENIQPKEVERTRDFEYRLESSTSSYPPSSREEDTRAMQAIEFPTSSCPLDASSIGSNDPKWDILK